MSVQLSLHDKDPYNALSSSTVYQEIFIQDFFCICNFHSSFFVPELNVKNAFSFLILFFLNSNEN